jgi:hypothetical protein
MSGRCWAGSADITSDRDDVEEALRQNLKLGRELAAEVGAKGAGSLTASVGFFTGFV